MQPAGDLRQSAGVRRVCRRRARGVTVPRPFLREICNASRAPPAEVWGQVPVSGLTASATPDDGGGGPVRRLPRGATLGRYVVLDCLGSGGMVGGYRARESSS